MPRSRPPYPPQFRRQMIAVVCDPALLRRGDRHAADSGAGAGRRLKRTRLPARLARAGTARAGARTVRSPRGTYRRRAMKAVELPPAGRALPGLISARFQEAGKDRAEFGSAGPSPGRTVCVPGAITERDDRLQRPPSQHSGNNGKPRTGGRHEHAAGQHHGRDREQRGQCDQGRCNRPAEQTGLPPDQRGDDHQADRHHRRERAKSRPVRVRSGGDARRGSVTGDRVRPPVIESDYLHTEHRARHAFSPRRELEPDSGEHDEHESDSPCMRTVERHSTCRRIERFSIQASHGQRRRTAADRPRPLRASAARGTR